jgi:hypothetical protein
MKIGCFGKKQHTPFLELVLHIVKGPSSALQALDRPFEL